VPSELVGFLRADRMTRVQHPRYRSSVVLVAVMGAAASSFTGALLFGSLPTIAKDLNTSTSVISWLGIAPSIAFAVSMPLFGKVGDLYGHRRVFIVGWAVAAVLALAAAAAPNAAWLIALRTAGQLAGTSTSPAAYGVVAHLFEPEERAGPYARVTVALAISPIIGVAVGGPLVTSVGWRVMFVGQGIVSALAVLVAIALLPETPRRLGVRFDVAGVCALAVGLTTLLLAVNRARAWGIDNPVIWALGAAGIVGLATFVVVEHRVAEPLLAPAMLRNRVVASAMSTSMLVNAGFNGLDVLSGFAAAALFGYDASAISWINAIRAMGFAIGAAGARRFLQAQPSHRVVMSGHVVVALSFVVVAYGAHRSSAAIFIVAIVIGSFGTGFGRPSLATAITNAVGPGDAGIANGANNMAHQVGASIGQTVLIAIAASATSGSVAVACLVAAAFAAMSVLSASGLRARPALAPTASLGT
jgi:predicted MFS family arabinose efflux permease